jgi:branched-chain amino acid transport system substrate-binding protein
MRRLIFVTAGIFLLAFFPRHLLAQEARFGIPLPLTGTNAKFGEIEKNAYQIATEELNAVGAIKGRKIVLDFED